MGKTTAANTLRRLGLPLFDADAAVHEMLAPGGAAVTAVETAFPGVRDQAGGIDRGALGRRVFGDAEALRRLERILHPIVREWEHRFLRQARARRDQIAVLDIPLLYETGRQRLCDAVIVVSAPAWLQRQRVMRRPGMTDSRFRAILASQLPDREKRRRADFIVPTGQGRGITLRRLQRVLRVLRQRVPRRPVARARRAR